MDTAIKTPQTHPDHEVVGKYWGGHSIKHSKTAVYYCDSYDPRLGFWMTNIADATDRKNISDMAIGRTFWRAYEEGDYYWISQWGQMVFRSGELNPKMGEPGWRPRVPFEQRAPI